MTQQYIVGQLSSLLSELESARGEWPTAVRDLRRDVESSPLTRLPELARKALNLIDMICWADLEDGDMRGFSRHAQTALALHDFADSARLLP
jgi:hypothetical protein